MTNYKNFPLKKGQYQLSQEELLMYLNVFMDHKFSLSMENNVYLASLHMFYDRLTLKVIWKIENKNLLFVSSINSIDDLMILREKNIISFQKVEIIAYSKAHFVPSEEAIQNFQFMIQGKYSTAASPITYHTLEYEIEQPTAIPDVFFQDLLEGVHNLIAFERFLEEKKKKDSVT